MSEFLELEYKYKASAINLTHFQNLMAELGSFKHLTCSSFDTYYTKNAGEFVRFRDSTTPELTIKRKIEKQNNWSRVEVDLPLDVNACTPEKVDHFLRLLEYAKNFKIYKSCFVYWLHDVNFVYYVVYDENLAEYGRFIEIEVNKDKISSQEEGIKLLDRYEKLLTPLGVTKQHRMKKSLFELYSK